MCSVSWRIGGWTVANGRLLTCVLPRFHSLVPRVFTGCPLWARHRSHLLVTVVARAKEDFTPASPFTTFCACPRFTAHSHLVVWSPSLSPDTGEDTETEKVAPRVSRDFAEACRVHQCGLSLLWGGKRAMFPRPGLCCWGSPGCPSPASSSPKGTHRQILVERLPSARHGRACFPHHLEKQL